MCERRAGAGDGRVGRVAARRLAAACGTGCRGVRVPGGAALARAVASRILCALPWLIGCGDEPADRGLWDGGRGVGATAYALAAVRAGSRAVPVDLASRWIAEDGVCGDAAEADTSAQRRWSAGYRLRPCIDCEREGMARGPKPAAPIARGAGRQPLPPVLDLLRRLGHVARRPDRRRRRAITATTGSRCRSGSDPTAASRSAPPPIAATTTRGASANWGSDAGFGPLEASSPRRSAPRAAGRLGARDRDAARLRRQPRRRRRRSRAANSFTPGNRVHLIPLEPIATTERSRLRRSVRRGASGPGADPEATGTD